MVDLLIHGGSKTGACFRLSEVPTIVGRSPEAHLRIDDPWISNLHALFELRGGELWVVDLGSLNGTFVDGARVGEARVGPGTLVHFGQTEARVESLGLDSRPRVTPATPVHPVAVTMTGRHDQVRVAPPPAADGGAAD